MDNRDVKYTMENNKMFRFVQTILNGGKVPKKDNREEKAQAEASANETVAMLNAQKNTQKKENETPEEAFGDRQKRRNPSKRRKKRK